MAENIDQAVETENEQGSEESAEEQQVLDDLTVLTDDDGLETVETELHEAADDDWQEPDASQSMATIHTGSQPTHEELVRNLALEPDDEPGGDDEGGEGTEFAGADRVADLEEGEQAVDEMDETADADTETVGGEGDDDLSAAVDTGPETEAATDDAAAADDEQAADEAGGGEGGETAADVEPAAAAAPQAAVGGEETDTAAPGGDEGPEGEEGLIGDDNRDKTEFDVDEEPEPERQAVEQDLAAEAPDLTTQAAAGAEDSAIALDIDASLVDTDGSESLSITISGVPDGATLSAGTDNGDGTWTLGTDDLDGLSVTPPADSSDDFQLTVIATSTEASSGDTATATGTLDVSVTGVADAPDLTVADAAGTEDQAISLDLSAAVTDASETLSITIAGLPDGAILSAGTDNGGGTWTLSANDLTGLTVTPAANSDADFTLSVTATSTDGADTATTTGSINVSVAADADAPTLTMSDATGTEDQAISLDLSAAVTDASESLSITIAGVPDGATLSAGTDNGDGTWTLSANDLAGLTVTPPADSDADFTLSVTATSTDGADTATTTGSINVSVAADADAPTLSVSDTAGTEDTAISLDLSSTLTDASETLSVTISDVPDGATLSAGTDNGDGTWTLGADDLAGLTVTPPTDSDVDFTLSVAATSTDGSDTATTTGSINVSVDGNADTATLSASVGTGTADPGPTPVAYWNLDENADGSVADSIGNNDGQTHHGMDMNDSGQYGTSAAEFRGGGGGTSRDEYIDVADSADSHLAEGSFTVWINPDDEDEGTIVSKDGPGNNDGDFTLSLDNGALKLTMSDGSQTVELEGGNVNDDEWSQVTVSWGSDGLKIYQNGDLVASDDTFTGGIENNTNDWMFGVSQEEYNGSHNSLKDYFNGHMDDIALYGDQLTDTEAAGLYQDGVQDFMDNGGTTVTYPLNVAAGTTDSSESLSITIDGVPDGTVLSAGTDNGDGTWTLESGELDGLTMTVPETSNDFMLNVTATTTDGTDVANSTELIQVDVDGGGFSAGIEGTSGADALSGTVGDDLMMGGAGDDTITAAAGDDTIVGGEGDDVIDGGAGNDIVDAGAGNDAIEGSVGDDHVMGGEGDDLFIFGAGDGSDYFDGGNGWSDTIQLEDVSGGPGGASGWTIEVDGGGTYTEGESDITFDAEASGTITLEDGSQLSFEGVESIDW